ncbi:MAG: DNA methyltransferase Dim-2 [Claussenomyces sp. TS43310]|nr:MAG: DNA methyltransferase Dim-2 [Claussenomyces sp. TS43310]
MPPLVDTEDESEQDAFPSRTNCRGSLEAKEVEPDLELLSDIGDEQGEIRSLVILIAIHVLILVATSEILDLIEVSRSESTEFMDANEKAQSELVAEAADEVADLEGRPQGHTDIHLIRGSQFVYPLSQYQGYEPPLLVSEERRVIKEFIGSPDGAQARAKTSLNATFHGQDFTEFELSEFSIYLPGTVAHHAWEMNGLQNLATKIGNSSYLFDGILTDGHVHRYVQGVPFKSCPIGNYGEDIDTVGGDIWILSNLNKAADIYYRLKTPSEEYARYHNGFIWLADLAKHLVDYSQSAMERGHLVSIHDFRLDFAKWLGTTHQNSSTFWKWFSRYNHRDFRRAVVANIEFLYKETIGVSDSLRQLPLWRQVMTTDFIPEQRQTQEKTIVTPYVYDCFSHLIFGSHLKKAPLAGGVELRRDSLGKTLHLTVDKDSKKHSKSKINATEEVVSPVWKASRSQMKKKLDVASITVGTVLGVRKDHPSNSKWKDEVSKWKAADDCWYVHVQGIHVNKEGQREFDVIWLYRPSDTTCAKMRYSYMNELFLSNNCNCNSAPITEDELLCKVSIDWYGSPEKSRADFFVRQTYLSNNSFVTMKDRHKQCIHYRDDLKTPLQQVMEKYKVGDTVLVAPSVQLKSKHGLEPCQIEGFLQDGTKNSVVLRRLLRRREIEENISARPNELLFSDEMITVLASKVERRIYVRFYSQAQADNGRIPTPYDRDGTGDAYYITSQLVGRGADKVLIQFKEDTYPVSLIQGFDPESPCVRRPMQGMDLYCGGGNFGRGLEEGGGVKMKWAVDLNKNAIHTYFAHLADPEETEMYLGSVDDLLEEALRGNPAKSKLIPLPGEVDFISAGSPCQGFSLMNTHRGNDKGLKNQSLVASVAAYIDFYRPKHAILENVISMAKKGRGRDEDVLSQLMCCLVGMGYQVQVFTLDSWSFGSPQSRSRLFVSIAAPGLELPQHPGLSHSHPAGTSDRGLGKMANGHAFGERQFRPTPFEFVTAGEANADLPDIGDGRTKHCTLHPDHRLSRGVSQKTQSQIETIPLAPYGMNFAKTYGQGRMTEAERALFPRYAKSGKLRPSVMPTSRAWGRIHPQKLFPTIATMMNPQDYICGRALHWSQQRLITVMEVRRAQSFPDHEVLVGSPAEQWRIIGNSVARTVALALGLSLREAWLKGPMFDPVLPGAKLPTKAREMLKGTRPVTTVKPRSQPPPKTSKMVCNISRVRNLEGHRQPSPLCESNASDNRFKHSLETSGLRSSVSQDEDGSSVSSLLSIEESSMMLQKRTFNLPRPAELSSREIKDQNCPPSGSHTKKPGAVNSEYGNIVAHSHHEHDLGTTSSAAGRDQVLGSGQDPALSVSSKAALIEVTLPVTEPEDHADEDVIVPSGTKRSVYVPADSSMFKPCERSYNAMSRPKKRQRLRKEKGSEDEANVMS